MTRFEDVIERDGRLVYTNVGDSTRPLIRNDSLIYSLTRPHNPKVVGSNPAPATSVNTPFETTQTAYFFVQKTAFRTPPGHIFQKPVFDLQNAQIKDF